MKGTAIEMTGIVTLVEPLERTFSHPLGGSMVLITGRHKFGFQVGPEFDFKPGMQVTATFVVDASAEDN
jgi:hypothetical protein